VTSVTAALRSHILSHETGIEYLMGKATIIGPQWEGTVVSREVRNPKHIRKQLALEPGDPGAQPRSEMWDAF
jgi:hypothetical protein